VSTSPPVADVLDDQHRRVAELFELVRSPDADRPAVLSRLLKDLAAHIATERAIIEPVVEARANDQAGSDLAAQLMDDYERMERLIVLIERRKPNSPDVPDLVGELMEVATEHNQRASEELVPALNRALSGGEQQELASKLAEAESMTTTHPHPHLLSLGPISDKLVNVLSRWDRMRDRTVTNLPASRIPPPEEAAEVREEIEQWRTRTSQGGRGRRGRGDT
jgi:hypothetical protein